MDQSQLKQCAKRLHSYLQPQLGVAFKLGNALDLVAALPGLRRWPEVTAFPDQVARAELTMEAVQRLSRRIEQRYHAQVDAELLMSALAGEMSSLASPPIRSGIPKIWICDVCQQPITSVERGYVIWKSGYDGGNEHSFKIIHQTDCDLDDHDCSSALREFLGLDGLNLLLSHLSSGPVRKHLGRTSRAPIPDLDEFVDFIRRVQIPYYDQARRRFSHPKFLEDFYEAGELTPYRPEMLRRIIEDQTYEV